MVRAGVDGRETVCSWGNTASDVRSEHTVNSSDVKTLEERKVEGVGDRGLRERVELLDDNVRVADNGAGTVDLAGRSVVVGRGSDEVTGDHVVDCH